MRLTADVAFKPDVVWLVVDESSLPIPRVVLRVVHGDDDFELRRADLADAPLGGRRAKEYEINPWGLK